MKLRQSLIGLCLAFLLLGSIPVHTHAMSAQGAILMEQESGRVLYEHNAHTQMRIASITKIMTVLLAVESGKLEETVTVSDHAAGVEGSSLYLKEGNEIKLEDLLYGLMLRSGNDAAVAVAEHVAGDLQSFVDLMNEKAKKIGMKQTTFANPHGLDDHENHYSTAYDMAILTKYAQENPTFKKIFGTKKYECDNPNGGVYRWVNKNRLLTGMYKHSTGGKTGYTRRAKRTLVSTAEKDGMELIAVTLNDRNDWNDHMSLFEGAYSDYKLLEVLPKGELGQEFIRQTNSSAYVPDSFHFPVTDSEKGQLSVTIEITKPFAKEQLEEPLPPVPIGTAHIYLRDKEVGNVTIYSH